MTSSDESINLSPVVLQVIDQFVKALHADKQIPTHAIDGLNAILRQGIVPKPDQLYEILFAPSEDKPNENEVGADAEGG